MDTKLKKLLRQTTTKTVLILVVLMAAGVFAWLFTLIVGDGYLHQVANRIEDAANGRSYKDSHDFSDMVTEDYNNLLGLLTLENQKEDLTTDEKERLEEKMEAYTVDLYDTYRSERNLDDNESSGLASEKMTEDEYDIPFNLRSEEILKDKKFMEVHGKTLEEKRKILTEDFLEERAYSIDQYKKMLYDSVENNGLAYHGQIGDMVLNSAGDLKPEAMLADKDLHAVQIKGNQSAGNDDAMMRILESYMGYPYSRYLNEKAIALTMGYSSSVLEEKALNYEAVNNEMQAYIVIMLSCLALSLLATIALMVGIGRNPANEAAHLQPVDKIPLEVTGILLLAVSSFAVFTGSSIRFWIGRIWFVAWVLALTAMLLHTVLKITRLIKAEALVDNLWTLRLLRWCFRLCRSFLRFIRELVLVKSKLATMFIIGIVGIYLVGMTQFRPFALLLIPIIAIGARELATLDQVVEGVAVMKKSDEAYTIPVMGEGRISKMAEDINSLHRDQLEMVREAVDKELKSERLKTELITNVSHDLRTPLTSIITYIDLMKNEDLTEDERKDYLNVLENKAQRLKKLTDDLFDAAKASSQNIDVDLKDLDLVALVKQGLGEFEEKLQNKNIEICLETKTAPVMVRADGNHLWRVLENLLGNVSKYALPGSRVYIDVLKDEQTGSIVIKNISEEPLNIDADTLMERFMRGDVSRYTEGSGLGLAIAKDLMHLQRGDLNLFVDGDFFKATCTLALSKETIDQTTVEEQSVQESQE